MNSACRAATLSLAVVLFVAACGPTATATPAAVPAVVSPSAPADPAFEALVARSIEFRTKFGLRSDEAWVRTVAADPSASLDFDVPLTEAEASELQARESTAAQVGPILSEYGEQHPDEFAGLYIDQEAGGVLVVMFTGRLEEHAAAIAKLVRPGAPIEVRPAPLTEDELMAVFDRLDTDAVALRSLGIVVMGASIRTESNTVEVDLSTERPDAAEVIFARYGQTVVPRVVDPTGAYVKPRGTIVGRVVDKRGRGVVAVLGATPLFAEIPLDSMGLQTDPDGTFRLGDYLSGTWQLTAEAPGLAPASTEVEVPPGGVVTVELVLEPVS